MLRDFTHIVVTFFEMKLKQVLISVYQFVCVVEGQGAEIKWFYKDYPSNQMLMATEFISQRFIKSILNSYITV